MPYKKAKPYRLIYLAAAASIAGCGLATGPGQPEECLPGASSACTDQTVAGVETVEASWDPVSRRFASITYRHDTLLPNESFIHFYTAALKDSLVYWVSAIDGNDTAWSGYSRHHYSGGSLDSIVHHNRRGEPFKTVRYDSAGNILAANDDAGCVPGAAEACADTIDSITPYGDTLEVNRQWDPVKREYLELARQGDWIVSQASFLHLYNAQLRDSIVYWIDYIDDKGVLNFSGWGAYRYDSSGALSGIDNYDAFTGERYGYVRFDNTGNKVEEMADGFVEVYENGRVTKSYGEGGRDTTLYGYNDTGGLVEQREKQGETLRRQRLYGDFDNGASQLIRDYDSAGILRTETYRNTDYRIVQTIAYAADGSVALRTDRSYWPEQKYNLKEVATVDGQGEHVRTLWYNEDGHAVEYQLGDNEPGACREPYSPWRCITGSDTLEVD